MKSLLLLIISSIMPLCSSFSYDLVVAKDGSGDVVSIQQAFDKVPENANTRFVIFAMKSDINLNVPDLTTCVYFYRI